MQKRAALMLLARCTDEETDDMVQRIGGVIYELNVLVLHSSVSAGESKRPLETNLLTNENSAAL